MEKEEIAAMDFSLLVQSFKRIGKSIEQNEQQLEQLRFESYFVPGRKLDGIPGGKGRTFSRAEAAATRIADTEQLIRDLRLNWIRLYREIRERLTAVEDIKLRLIAAMRILDGMSWTEIHDALVPNTERFVFHDGSMPKQYFARKIEILEKAGR